MYCKLTEDIALRRWPDTGQMVCVRGKRGAIPVPEKLAQILLRCDGEHDLETDAAVMLLMVRKWIEPCEKGEHPSEWSAYREYANLYFPMMNLMITGKCNFNCRHCFNAADNAKLMSEWDFDGLCGLLDQAESCGISSFTITGGEPMVHPRFMDILREIYRRGMTVFALNTNGWFITRDILNRMKEIGCVPEMKISLDGIGTHDWMRQHPGSEKRALDAIRLCAENGFPVECNTQVHRLNLHTMIPTAETLNDLGVRIMRIIRTTEAPRWAENAPDACLGIEEYYGKMLDFAAEYARSGMRMDVKIWQFLTLFPREKRVRLDPVRCPEGACDDSVPCCECTRQMAAVTAEGELLPCLQFSGYTAKYGISMGNVRQTPLKELLSGGLCMDLARLTASEARGKISRCRTCPHFQRCAGGCRALGLLFAEGPEDFWREDITKCIFFGHEWPRKIAERLAGWKTDGC